MRFCPTPIPTTRSDERVRSWDGAPLQVDVTLPPTGTGPWPTIVILPGFGGSDGVSWEASQSYAGGNQGNGFSNVSFAKRGYAVVTMNFRGVGYSCGPPYTGQTASDIDRVLDFGKCHNVTFEFADQRYDDHDVQYVLGLLVDEGIAKADALGVAGESLGSLVTTELALLYNRVRLLNGQFEPWTSPDGIPLHIAAAYPIWAIDDLIDGLAPNGRFLWFEPQTATSDATPIGSIKLSVPAGIAAEALEDVQTAQSQADGFDLDGDTLFGEIAAPDPALVDNVLGEIRRYHQAIGIPIGSGVAPLLIQDGWDDLLVDGATQAMRMVDYLALEDPKAKVALQLADVGHPLSLNKTADDAALDRQANAFFNHYLRGRRGGPAPGSVTAYSATCPATAASAGPYTADGMAALDPGAVRFSSAAPQLVDAGGNPTIGVELDPIVGQLEEGTPHYLGHCNTFAAVNQNGTAVYTHRVTQTFTMLGFPVMRMHIAESGDNGQIDARLWDVAPDGQETYVSSATYTLTDNQTATITWQLYGGGHTFKAGDTIRVELMSQDLPLERVSETPFSVAVSDVTIELPAHERPNGGAIVKPVLAP